MDWIDVIVIIYIGFRVWVLFVWIGFVDVMLVVKVIWKIVWWLVFYVNLLKV